MSLFLTAFCIPLTGLPTQTARTVCKSNVLLKAEFLLYERVSLMTAIQGQGRVCFPVKENFMSTHSDPLPSVSLHNSDQAHFHLPAVNPLRTSLKKHTAKP